MEQPTRSVSQLEGVSTVRTLASVPVLKSVTCPGRNAIQLRGMARIPEEAAVDVITDCTVPESLQSAVPVIEVQA